MNSTTDIESDSDDDAQQLREINEIDAVLRADELEDADRLFHSSSSSATNPVPNIDPDDAAAINTALSLNKLIDEKMERLEKILKARYKECKLKIFEVQGTVTDKSDKPSVFRYVACGKPYFRDRNNFPAPDNADTILMAKSNMYDFSNVTSVPGWTVKDKSNFLSLILKLSKNLRKKTLNSKVAQLRRELKRNRNEDIQNQIIELKEEIQKINKMSAKELALPIDEEYDWDTVANKLNYRHIPTEYRSLWKLFLHPSINKSTWTNSEHEALGKIAHANNLQDWEKIARELNTGRTGYQCFVYFRTNMSNTFTGQKWTKEEEEYLKRLIEYFREDEYIPWVKVAGAMENRTKIQVYNKYARLGEDRKGRFLREEDSVILTCIQHFGKDFKKIQEYLPGRSAIQLRTRYGVLKKQKRVSVVWTIEEDKKLLQLMSNQDVPTNFSIISQHFPDKDRIHIRARYHTLNKWSKRHSHIDISRAPRRGARRLLHGQATEDLNKALEDLKNKIQSEVEHKKVKSITRESPEHVIEDAIIAALVNEQIKSDNRSGLDDSDSVEASTSKCTTSMNQANLQSLLLILRAKLNKAKFEASEYSKQYPNLLKPVHDSCVVKIKSYSKKEAVKTIIIEDVPDIWGGKVFPTSTYILPPNYSTITGCRRLMAFASSKMPAELRVCNLSLLARRNVVLREQLDLLISRFNTLFMWPLLLSNEGPIMPIAASTNVGRRKSRSRCLEGNDSKSKLVAQVGDPGVTIRYKNMTLVQNVIDLPQKSVEQQDIVVSDVNIGSEDFRCLKE